MATVHGALHACICGNWRELYWLVLEQFIYKQAIISHHQEKLKGTSPEVKSLRSVRKGLHLITLKYHLPSYNDIMWSTILVAALFYK